MTKKVSISKHQQSHSLEPLQVVTSVGKRVTKSANTFGPNVASCFTRVAACGRGLRVRKKCWPDWIDRSRVLSAVQCRRCRVLGRLRNLAERYTAPSPRKLTINSAKCPQPSLMNVLELYRAACAGTTVRWDALRAMSRRFLLGGMAWTVQQHALNSSV